MPPDANNRPSIEIPCSPCLQLHKSLMRTTRHPHSPAEFHGGREWVKSSTMSARPAHISDRARLCCSGSTTTERKLKRTAGIRICSAVVDALNRTQKHAPAAQHHHPLLKRTSGSSRRFYLGRGKTDQLVDPLPQNSEKLNKVDISWRRRKIYVL